MGPQQAALSRARASVVPGSERLGCTSGPLFKVSQGLPEVRDSCPPPPPPVHSLACPVPGSGCPGGGQEAPGGGRAICTTRSHRGQTDFRPRASDVLRWGSRASGLLAIPAVRKRSVTPPLRLRLAALSVWSAGFSSSREPWPPQGC